VARDTSLDEFATDDGGRSDGDGDGSSGTVDDGIDGSPEGSGDPGAEGPGGESGGVEPTHQWTPTGAVCSRCGESVDRRWRADEGDGMVCDACKGW
jgi:hypothetical protein